jgi:NitT/TauT family transport system substrate-binding protein
MRLRCCGRRNNQEDLMRSFKFAVAGIGLLGLLAATSASAAPLKIRLSWIVPIGNWGSLLLEKKDLARHFGQSYTLEVTRYAGTPPMITALAAGELDIADLTYSTVPIAIQNAGLDDLRVISDEFQDGNPGYYSNEFMVLNDGPIKKVEDLKGKVVATNAAGSAVDIAMRAMLRKHGLEANRDYTIVESPFPTMKAMLNEKKVDLIPAVIPFSLDPQLRSAAHTLFTIGDAVGLTEFSMFVARKPFIDKNRAALVDFMEDTLRIVRWYIDPANHQQVMEICARLTRQPVDRFGWVFTKQDNYRDPNMLPDLAALQRNVDTMKDLGYVKANVDVKAHADLSIIEEAAKRLK